MKSCRRCFENVYIGFDGNVTLCPWNIIIVGNLLENTLDEIWNGEKADEVRRAFLRGEFKGCMEHHCPDCIHQTEFIQFKDEEEVRKLYDNILDYPSRICMAYDKRCNHACPSCRSDFFKPDKQYREDIKKITDNIEPYIEKIDFLDLNGGGEVFVCDELMDLVSRLNPKNPNFQIYFETNGVMFKDNWDKVKHLANYNLVVSVTPNSFNRTTYDYLAGRDDLDKFYESFELMKELREEGKINHLRVTMVVQDSNFWHIPEFVEECIKYKADDIILRPIFKWFCLDEDVWFFKNILNPAHPYHEQYKKVIEHPILKDCRVYDWGLHDFQEPISFKDYFTNKYNFESKNVENCLSKISKDIENNETVVYGAGKIGRELLKGLISGKSCSKITNLAVTDTNSCVEYYLGYQIEAIAGIENIADKMIIIATTNADYRDQMINKCTELGVNEDKIIVFMNYLS